jgi:hypothetical protein
MAAARPRQMLSATSGAARQPEHDHRSEDDFYMKGGVEDLK